MQRLQLRLDLVVALGQLRADEVKGIERLLEGKRVLGAPATLQAHSNRGSVWTSEWGWPDGPIRRLRRGL